MNIDIFDENKTIIKKKLFLNFNQIVLVLARNNRFLLSGTKYPEIINF